jgi:hypothetical protein
MPEAVHGSKGKDRENGAYLYLGGRDIEWSLLLGNQNRCKII